MYITKDTPISLLILWKAFSGFSIKNVPWYLYHRQNAVLPRCGNQDTDSVIKCKVNVVSWLLFGYSYYSFEIRRIHDVAKLWKGAYYKIKRCGRGGLFKESLALVVREQKTISSITINYVKFISLELHTGEGTRENKRTYLPPWAAFHYEFPQTVKFPAPATTKYPKKTSPYAVAKMITLSHRRKLRAMK